MHGLGRDRVLVFLGENMTKKWTVSTKYPNVIIVTQWKRSNLDEQVDEEEIKKLLPPWRRFLLNVHHGMMTMVTWLFGRR